MEDRKPRDGAEENLRDATLLFLIKKIDGEISDICLAMKKRGFGMGRWNGSGGKVEEGETVRDAALRETKEEIGVEPKNLQKVAEVSFYFPHKPAWDQKVHIYFCDEWNGEPTESEEMRPQWFSVSSLPFDTMWPDDRFWVPEVLAGKLVRGMFVFGEGDIIQEKNIEVVETLGEL